MKRRFSTPRLLRRKPCSALSLPIRTISNPINHNSDRHCRLHHTQGALYRSAALLSMRQQSTNNFNNPQTSHNSFTAKRRKKIHFPYMANTTQLTVDGPLFHLLKEVKLFSNEAFMSRLHRFSRVKFNHGEHFLEVYALLENLIDSYVHQYVNDLAEGVEHGKQKVPDAMFHSERHTPLVIHRVPFHNNPISRMNTLPPSAILNYMRTAYTAGLHHHVLCLYHFRRQCQLLGNQEEGLVFTPSSFVIDSAYTLRNSGELVELASHCHRLLTASPTEGEKDPKRLSALFSLLRAVWRCVCLREHFTLLEGSTTPPPAMDWSSYNGKSVSQGRVLTLEHAATTTAAQALADTQTIMDQYIFPLYQRNQQTRNQDKAIKSSEELIKRIGRLVKYDQSGDDGEMLFYQMCLQENILQLHHIVKSDTTTNTNQDESAVWSEDSLLLANDSEEDTTAGQTSPSEGDTSEKEETEYSFRLVPLKNSLHHNNTNQSSTGGLHNTVNLALLSAEELFYSSLLNSCEKGRHSATALAYYDLLRLTNGRSTVGEDGATTTNKNDAAILMQLAGVNPTGDNSADHHHNHTNNNNNNKPISEFVLHRLLWVLNACKENKKILNVGRTVLKEKQIYIPAEAQFLAAPDNTHRSVAEIYNQCSGMFDDEPDQGTDQGSNRTLSVTSWTVLLIAAGEENGLDIALSAFYYAYHRLVGGGSSQASKTGSADVIGQERKTYEYLLQTALVALSKVRVPHYTECYLEPAFQTLLPYSGRELYLCCLLQDAYNAVNPLQRTQEVVLQLEREGIPLSTAIVHRLLRIYLRTESDTYLVLYRHVVEELLMGDLHTSTGNIRFNFTWLQNLILWADRRRYALTQEERGYIIQQVVRYFPPDDSNTSMKDYERVLKSNQLGGLRPHFGTLCYDYEVDPCQYFKSHYKEGMRDPVENRKTGVPPREPTVMDSRLHFVLRRPELCRRGLSCPSEDGVEENRAGAVSLVPFLHIDRYIDSVFDANDGGAHHVNGRYYLIGDPSRKKSISTMVDMSGSAIPVEELPNHNNNNHPPPTSNEEDALRLYLGDLLEGLQRSQNYAK